MYTIKFLRDLNLGNIILIKTFKKEDYENIREIEVTYAVAEAKSTFHEPQYKNMSNISFFSVLIAYHKFPKI